MDPNYLDELKKLKEQKDADSGKLQEIAKLSIPDFDEEEPSPTGLDENNGGTIKFSPVKQPEDDLSPIPTGGRRARRMNAEEAERLRRQKKKKRNIVLIVIASILALIAILAVVFFAVRNANMDNYTYQYWGMGLSIENGVPEYSLFGNLKTLTRYDVIGQVEALAEFEDGNCVKETVFTPEGDVDSYYTHEYEDGTRVLSAYYSAGQLVVSETYVKESKTRIHAESTYYLEENRIETAVLTLSAEGNLTEKIILEDGVTIYRAKYNGTLISEAESFYDDGTLRVRTVYEYNEKKQLLTQTEYDSANIIHLRTVNQYSDKGLLTKTIRYDGAGAIIDFDTYNYDLNDNPIKQVRYNAEGAMIEQILRVFNDKNRITKETSLQADGTIIYCNGYDYDEKGYVIKTIVYDNVISTMISKYSLYTRSEDGSIQQIETYNSSNILIEKQVYNTAGFLTNYTLFNDSGVLTVEQKIQYDAKQRISQQEVTTYSDLGEKLIFRKEQFDEKGNVTVRILDDYTADLYEQILYRYNENNTLIQQTYYDRNGKTLCDQDLNESGLVESETLFENGFEKVYQEYTYNSDGNITLMKSLDLTTNVLIKTSFTYNAQGVLTEQTETNNRNIPIVSRKYDESGNVSLLTWYDAEGLITESHAYTYDELGQTIVDETYDAQGMMSKKIVYYYFSDGSFAFTEYDGEGNLIFDSQNPNGTPDPDPDQGGTDDPDNTDPEQGGGTEDPEADSDTNTDN